MTAVAATLSATALIAGCAVHMYAETSDHPLELAPSLHSAMTEAASRQANSFWHENYM
jgi:hypothetical protein